MSVASAIIALSINERKKMQEFANWKSYPFTVDGVEFVSLIDPNGSMYQSIAAWSTSSHSEQRS